MSEAKFHHFVPRFYLARFSNHKNKLWVFDKETDKIFASAPENVGGANHFYRLNEFDELGYDPLTLEKQFADLESEVSNITQSWIHQFSSKKKLYLPDINREIISLYITTQLLRTVEAREQLIQLSSLTVENYDARDDSRNLHVALLWDEPLINKMKQQISDCIWVFGKNNSNIPFYTSDQPVLIKTCDNKQWVLGPRVFDKGNYIVFPLTPKLIMYCKEPKYWGKIRAFENSVTPIDFTEDMVKHENSGQIGMSNRFVFSNENNFDFAREFLLENVRFKNSKRDRF